jgi:predicted alpha/beta hydrolase family esterase
LGERFDMSSAARLMSNNPTWRDAWRRKHRSNHNLNATDTARQRARTSRSPIPRAREISWNGRETLQTLFIQGGGKGAYDEWDGKLVDDLRRELGDGHEVRYPRMPAEDDPSYARWSAAIRREMAHLSNGAVVAGHSVGGTIMIRAIAEQSPERKFAAIVLIAAPFVGEGGWPGDEFQLPGDLGARLPRGVRVHVFHGLDDETAPPSHADLYARAIPQAQVHRLPGRDHPLNNDLREVANAIRA